MAYEEINQPILLLLLTFPAFRDLEIIFPEKTVRMRPLDVVKFVATGCVAIIVRFERVSVHV